MSSSSPLSLIAADISLLLKSSDPATPRLSLSSLLPPSSSSTSSSSVPPLSSTTPSPSRAPTDPPATPEEALRLVKDLTEVSGEAKLAEGKVDVLGERVDSVRGTLEEVQSGLKKGMEEWKMEVGGLHIVYLTPECHTHKSHPSQLPTVLSLPPLNPTFNEEAPSSLDRSNLSTTLQQPPLDHLCTLTRHLHSIVVLNPVDLTEVGNQDASRRDEVVSQEL
ncbi:hypothetical protein BDY24DRAFT_414289 [Mrakia frigida]|uniref:uncharacterized protein n=1 Tax=Mrakia frigida TaxID=29902 RepID=UPI003FCC01DA